MMLSRVVSRACSSQSCSAMNAGKRDITSPGEHSMMMAMMVGRMGERWMAASAASAAKMINSSKGGRAAAAAAGGGGGGGGGKKKKKASKETEVLASEMAATDALTVSTESRRVVGLPRPPWTPSRDLDKAKTHMKRAGYMMRVLDHEQQVNSPNFNKFPHFSAGDVLEVAMQSAGNRARTTTFRGIVIARRNKGYASNVTLRNAVQGLVIERTLPLYSPHLISLKVLEKRSVRRAKLYYLRDKEIRYSKV